MNCLFLIIKGFIIGIAKILPGVSGAVLSISLGVYEKLLSIMAHPLHLKYNDIKFLFFLLFGVGLGIVIFSSFIQWCLNFYYLPTMFLFIGFIVGGFPEIVSVIKKQSINSTDIILFFMSFFLILILTNLSSTNNSSENHYFLMGIIESLTTIIPGISGTAIFMALGWYKNLLETITLILTFRASINICFNFISGFIIATILISKILNYVFKKYKVKSYITVMGFMCGSILVMCKDLFLYSYNLLEIIISTFLFILGITLTIKLNKLFDKY